MGEVSMQSPNEALTKLGVRAEKQFDQMLESNTFLKAFHEGTETHQELYRRHILETAIRIRMNNVVDSFALTRTIQDDPMAEHLLAYLHEEYGHDRMFEEDLRVMGLSEQDLAQAEPLFATDLLMAFLWKSVERDGMLPALIWDWLVEWYSARYNPQITETAATVAGADSVRQTKRHLELDEELEHEDGLTRALTTLIERDSSFSQAERYVDRFVRLIEMYFHELLDQFDR
jgi:hypothetical protein